MDEGDLQVLGVCLYIVFIVVANIMVRRAPERVVLPTKPPHPLAARAHTLSSGPGSCSTFSSPSWCVVPL